MTKRSKAMTWRDIRRVVRTRWGRAHLAIGAGAGIIVAVLGGRAVVPGHTAHPAALPPPARADTAPTDAAPARSRVVEGRLASAGVGKTLPYLVYLPPGYDSEPGRRYPVLYMLHGLGGSYRQWQEVGLLEDADRLMRSGELPPFLIVLPQGDDGYWVDHAGGGPRWGRFVAQELVTTIDGGYRTIRSREARALGGLSMGGHGALQVSINNPDVFGVVGAHSFALRRYQQAPPFFGDPAYFNAHDPVALYGARASTARTFRLWLDMGSDDGWRAAGEAFHAQLATAGITHEWHEFPGGHDAAYWSAHAEDYLRFYGMAFAARHTSWPDEATGLAR